MTEWEREVKRHVEASPVARYLVHVAAVRDITWARFEHPDDDVVIKVEEATDVDASPEAVAGGLIEKAKIALGFEHR